MERLVKVVSIDEEFEKGRGKDKRPRKRRSGGMGDLRRENIQLHRKYGIKKLTLQHPIRGEESHPAGKFIRTQMGREELEENVKHKNDPGWWKKSKEV
jgi:hypothetical protein